MSVITYLAKREIEKTGYSKTGADISANGATDTFDATSTNLAGLANDEWINVAGFANAANNGWFQANGASIATQITQDTSTALVTEAAGPSITIVGYRRGYGQPYSIEFTPRRLDRGVAALRHSSRSLGGDEEVLLLRRDTTWDVVSGRITEQTILQWREFLASCAAGEGFTFDPYGTIAVPDAPVSSLLVRADYPEDRIGNNRRYTIPFKLRQA